MSSSPSPTAAIIIIGNEVLSGRTQDANLAYLARGLAAHGIVLAEARVIRDIESEIIAAVNHCRNLYTYVFTTGGIGPTHDDITAQSIANAFGVPLIADPEAVRRLERHFKPSDRNAARLKMANVAQGASLIDNPVSAAPGFQIGNVYVLPGVPRIMQAMFDGLVTRLQGGPPVLSRTISAFTREGSIAEALTKVQDQHSRTEIGSYPFVRGEKFGVSLVVRGFERDTVDAAAEAIKDMLRAMAVEPIEDI